jgi:formylglycine-generating enzyme required for sulfatase activity
LCTAWLLLFWYVFVRAVVYPGLPEPWLAAMSPSARPTRKANVQPAPARPDVRGASLMPGERFRDCPDDTLCPWLRVLPAGSFMMGSPKDEQGRNDDEDPQHRVTIANKFAVMEAEVTRGQFAQFVKETGYQTDGGCYVYKAGRWELDKQRTWADPGFAQTDAHPVVCVNWNDAKAYADWLSKKTRQTYRLLNEAEWEYAARAATQTRWSFGDDEAALCRFGNVLDASAKTTLTDVPKDWVFAACDDRHVYTAAGKTYQPNAWGLYDMHGNAWEWVEDCWHQNYSGAPADGTEWRNNCSSDGRRVLRGGGWINNPRISRSAIRVDDSPGSRNDSSGVRLARTLLGL